MVLGMGRIEHNGIKFYGMVSGMEQDRALWNTVVQYCVGYGAE